MHIVVPTCAAYSDAWGPFVTLFHKYWPACPYPVTLITDRADRPWDLGEVIEVGPDRGWCANFLAGLERIKPERVLLLQEDFWFNFAPDEAFIRSALEIMKHNQDVACFRLYPCPGPEQEFSPRVGLIRPSAAYRVSCQAAIWRDDELRWLLSQNNTPREFEIDGSRQSAAERANRTYLSVLEPDPNKWPLQYYCTAIVRGEWDPNALEFCQRVGVPVDTSRRSTLFCPR